MHNTPRIVMKYKHAFHLSLIQKTNLNFLFYYVCVCLYVHKHTSVGMYTPLCICRREDIFQELILSSHCVGPVDMSKGLATASLKPEPSL